MDGRLNALGLDEDRLRWFEKWKMSLWSATGIPMLVASFAARQWGETILCGLVMFLCAAMDVMTSLRRSVARSSAKSAVMQIRLKLIESELNFDQAIFAIMRVMEATRYARWEGTLNRRDPSEAEVRDVFARDKGLGDARARANGLIAMFLREHG